MRTNQTITSKAVILAGLLFLCLFTASNSFAYDYQVTAIQPPAGYTASRAMGINNLGEVVGRFYNVNPTTGEAINRKAFVWDPTNGAALLRTLNGESSAWGINDNGFVAGYSYNAAGKQRAALWDTQKDTILEIGALTNETTGQTGESSTAYGINNNNEVVGNADIPNDAGTFTPFHAFIYDDTNGIWDLGTLNTTMPEWQYGYSITYDMNNNGQVVGIAQDSPWAAFIYDDTNGMRHLPKDPAYTDDEWYAVVINDSGLIGGHVIAAANRSLPYYWPNASSAPVKIAMPAGFPYGEIYGINASGQMVGIMWSSDQAGATEHAFIFDTQNGVRDLNNVIDPASGWVLRFARDINDSGQIVGYGELNGNKRGFMLTLQSGQSKLACAFNSEGLFEWDGSAWNKINAAVPTSIAASGSILYANFAGNGLWKWDGSAWSRISGGAPQNIAASGSILYADFGSKGLWKLDGSAWSQINAGDPINIVASGSILYADFGANGLWKWDGSSWSKISGGAPQKIVASGSILYADFGANGLWKWEASTWSHLANNDPAIMVAGF